MDVVASSTIQEQSDVSDRPPRRLRQAGSTLLAQIESPADLRALPIARLDRLAEACRESFIDTVSHCGGHFASSLGAVELTIALHYVFNTPKDLLVWDVGHQAYIHKMLTGRRDRLASIRQRDGLSGFPRRDESVYDTFGVAHAGTSISAALGMALAAHQRGQTQKVVCVIGDGAMTAGMAYEALDHAGELGADLLVILNDNGMSISPSVGALPRHLAALHTPSADPRRRRNGRRHDAMRPRHPVALPAPGNSTPSLFENLGFAYTGPVDGHDIHALVKALRAQADRQGPRVLHVLTRKGKGHRPAEDDPVAYHSVSPGGRQPPVSSPGQSSPAYTTIFSHWLCDMAAEDPRLVAITPAMREGSGLVEFARRFPDRYFDVGIAEQHAVTLAAGLACNGMKPVVAIYSTFLQRAYDQLIHDVAIQNLPVLFALDRAGIVGPDGATHAGSFDLSYLRCIPNLVVMAPGDENECRRMLTTGYRLHGPAAVRYPRGPGPGAAIDNGLTPLAVGQAELRRRGRRTALLAFGAMLEPARQAAELLDSTLVNMRFIKPLDEALLTRIANDHALLVSIEDNAVAGGGGSAINEFLARQQLQVPVINLGLPDRFPEHGGRNEILAGCGLDAHGLARTVKRFFHNRRSSRKQPGN